jgi:hypothetical protein
MALTQVQSGMISGVSGSTISGSRSIPASTVPSGSVLQVVNANTNTAASNANGTLTDTGLTATITPLFSTSKILVIVDQSGCYKDSPVANGGTLRLYRNGSQIVYMAGRYAGDSGTSFALSIGSISTNYLDSPATTSAVTYKTQFSAESSGSAAVYVQVYGSTSTITLMEIAQ